MSDTFEMLVDVEVSLADARDLSNAVIIEFRNRGLIVGELTPDCALGGLGYRTGPSILTLYTPQSNESKFWKLVTSGIEPRIERTFNHWALGSSCESFSCVKCFGKVELSDREFRKAVIDAIEEWINELGTAELTCPHCKQSTPVTLWKAQPPLGFGNLSFCFWNWPPLDLPGWQLDIPELVRSITGHTIVLTWGRI